MTRCQHCGQQVEEGKQFCPYCGKPAGGEAAEARQAAGGAREGAARPRASDERPAPPRPEPMSGFGQGRGEADSSRRAIYIIVAGVALALTALLLYFALRPAPPRAEPRLEGGIRDGSPEFAQVKERLVVE
ncbi:MAG TPA: zinc-ribbon domain-containing protein, partial [Pyrinomonadaceae bacterium]